MIALSFLGDATALGDLCRERADTLKHMVADLIETGNWRDRGDAVKQLHADGYPTVTVMILVDEAIWEIKQRVIADVMSDEDVNHLASDVGAALSGHPGYGGSEI